MRILSLDLHSNPNVGLYGFATDSYCLLGRDVPGKAVKKIAEVLKVPVHIMTISNSSMIGAFVAGNSKMLLVPSITTKEEQKELAKLGIQLKVIETKLTALGNNLLCNDNGCLANPEFSAFVKKRIRQALDVKVVPHMLAGVEAVGACGIIANGRCLLHRDASDEELEMVSELLKAETQRGTVNRGSPYVKSGILCNSNGMIISAYSGGPEASNAYEALGFLEQEREEIESNKNI